MAAWKRKRFLENFAARGAHGRKTLGKIIRIENHQRTAGSDLVCLMQATYFTTLTLDTSVTWSIVGELPAERSGVKALGGGQIAYGEFDVVDGVMSMHECSNRNCGFMAALFYSFSADIEPRLAAADPVPNGSNPRNGPTLSPRAIDSQVVKVLTRWIVIVMPMPRRQRQAGAPLLPLIALLE
jgi:hypothetical protein